MAQRQIPAEGAPEDEPLGPHAAPPLDVAQLVADHHEALYRYAYRLAGQQADAEDLTQQTFLIAHQKLGQLRHEERARSWLFSVLRNCFLKSCRRQPPLPAASAALDINNVPENRPAGYPIDRRHLQEALGALQPEFRIVVLMFYFEGCSYKEIAEGLDLPMGTVMSRLARAKCRMRQALFGDESPVSPPDLARQPAESVRRMFDSAASALPARAIPVRGASQTKRDR